VSSLARASRSGIGWISTLQATKVAIHFISLVIIARLLDSSDYGLMAMVLTITAFANLYKDFGTGAALVQLQDVSNSLVNSVFWLNIALGMSIAICLIGLAPLISNLFSEPRLEPLVYWVSPIFIISALGIVPQSLLERNLSFKEIALIEIVASIVAAAVAVGVAFNGGGTLALVSQAIVLSTMVTGGCLLLARWKPSPVFSRHEVMRIWSFSKNLFIFNLTNYFHRNVDSILIGRTLGSAPLGLYSMAYRILLFPTQTITSVVNRVNFPVYSRFQHDLQAVGAHYLGTLSLITFLVSPVMALVWAYREVVVRIMLGPDWDGLPTLLAWLAPVGVCQALTGSSGAVLAAIGRSNVLRNLGFIGVPLLVLAIIVGLNWGVEGVAVSYSIMSLIWTIPVLWVVMHFLERGLRDIVRAIYKPLCLALLLAATWRQLFIIPLEPDVQISTESLILMALFPFVYMILSYRFWPRLVFEAAAFIGSYRPRSN
jgi:O-antigen/teichoic acid export membrane protein